MLPRRSVGPLARLSLVVLLLALLAVPGSLLLAKQGTLKTKDGQTFVGDITEKEKDVDVMVKGIKTTVRRGNVASIEYAASFRDEYQQKLAELAPDDADGRVELARRAFDNKEYEIARELLEDALKIEPKNEDAAELLVTVQRQMKLSPAARGGGDEGDAGEDVEPRDAGGGGDDDDDEPTTRGAGGNTGPASRLLTADEINVIRQAELRKSDRNVRVRIDPDARRRFLDSRDAPSPEEFNDLTPAEQAIEILDRGSEGLRRGVVIRNDPLALQQYRQQIQRTILTGCAAANCHGGSSSSAFRLHNPADSEAPAYTNFLILQNYSTKDDDGREWRMINRNDPEDSLLAQYALPPDVADLPHPKARNFRGVYRGTNDQRYRQLMQWLENTLTPVAPDYGIDLSRKPDRGSDDDDREGTQRRRPADRDADGDAADEGDAPRNGE